MNKFTETLKLNMDKNSNNKDPETNYHPKTNQSDNNKTKWLSKIKRWLKKPLITALITFLLVVGTVAAGYNYFNENSNKQNANEAEAQNIKMVKTAILDLSRQNTDTIATVGTVKAETQVEVVSLINGTVRGLFFNVGDKVPVNKILARLNNSSALINYSSSRLNLSNIQNNLEATKLITEETIRQAELGVTTAQESVRAAEIALKTAQDNLNNVSSLQEKSNSDIKDQALITFFDYLNTVNSALDQINYLIKAEGDIQLDGVKNVLGVENLTSLNNAEKGYLTARNFYNQIIGLNPARDTIMADFKQIITALNLTKQATDDTIITLNNTITSVSFNETALNTQKSNFAALRSNIVNAQAGTESMSQTLDNLDLVNKQELDALINRVKSAQNQLEQARIGYDNAVVTLASTKKAREQQLIGAQTSVDNAQGQLSIFGTQVSELAIKAPISGTITGKFVELGTEVNPGQKIATIAQTEKLKIEVSLPSEDIYRIESGQIVTIRNDLTGVISSIDPAADPITRKVRVEIIFDNKDNKLIPGTFVDIEIPITQLEKTHLESVFIPLRAVNITQNENYVFIAVGNKAKKVKVITGKTEGALIEILDGLYNGDELIVEGNKILEDEEGIKVVE